MKERALKKRISVPALTGGLLSPPTAAAACTACIFSSFEYALPHTGGWCLGMMVWFCAVRAITGHPVSAVLWSIAGFIAGGAFIGPYAFFLLGGIAFCITIKAFLPEKRGKLSKGSRIALLVVTTAAFIAMMVGLMISAHTRKTRSDADFILGQWGGHRQSLVLERLIAEQETVQLRRILAETDNEYLADKVARALEETKR